MKKYSYRNSKLVVMELFGKTVGYFDCISDAARKFGCSVTTITERIKRNAEINGVRIKFLSDEDDLESMECLSPPKEYGKTPRAKKGVVVDDNGELVKQEEPETKKEEKPLDREKYTIVSYKVRNGVECITPCPYKGFPKPMIGSVRCQKCTSFHGMSRSTHEVACSRKFYE